jgi:hypothetical protein
MKANEERAVEEVEEELLSWRKTYSLSLSLL